MAHNKRNQLRELHLFAGAGGGILGGMLCGHRTVCAVEIEKYPREVLLQRQRDGILPEFPIWDDVQTFDGNPWRGKVDIVCGGFPCQDISCAGKGAGIGGERSSMWKHMARIIGEIRPQYAFVENSPMLVGRGLATVLADFAEMGYDAKWGVIGADNSGLVHRRKRIWVLASNNDMQHGEWRSVKKVLPIKRISGIDADGMDKNEQTLRTILSSGLCRKGNEIPSQMDRLKAIGNGQVPAVARLAWRILIGEEQSNKK